MTRYTLEQREEQIKFHRRYIQNMIRNYTELTTGPDSERAVIIYRDLLDHIDEVFGKDEDQ